MYTFKISSSKSLITQLSFYDLVSTVDYEDYQSVTRFLDLIPQDTLAVASFRSKAYTRAVMHFESFENHPACPLPPPQTPLPMHYEK